MTKPRRVLHLIPNLGGGGAERQLTYLSKGLVDLGWEVHVGLNHAEVSNLPLLQRSGAVIHDLGVGGRSPFLLRHVRRLIANVRPSLVQTWLRPMDIFGGLASLSTRTPWILSERASDESYPPGLRAELRNVVGRRAAAVVSNSEKGRRYWTRLAPAMKQFVVPNGLPYDEIAATAPVRVEDHGIPVERPLVLFAGRFADQKNIRVMLRAFTQVVEQTAAVCVLAGQGPLEPLVRDAVNAHPGRIFALGYSDQLWAWLRRADLFVSVSLFEGNPNAVLEAAAAGCPLLVSDIAEHLEFLDASSAVLVPPNAPDAIAEAIVKALADPAGRMHRAAHLRDPMRSRSIVACAERYAAIYTALIDRT